MAKWAALVTIVLVLAFFFLLPPHNRAARIDRPPELPNGSGFTVFDAPGAGTTALEGTGGLSINANGDVAGGFVVGGNVTHGFVRTAGGTITQFDAPGAGAGKNQGTFPTSINSAGIVTGMVDDANSIYHGFVGPATGPFTVFDIPGAKSDLDAGTVPMSINTTGTITGFYRDTNLVYHGFLRTKGGSIGTFDAPGAGTNSVQGTYPININSAGVIVGYYRDSNYVNHAFMRDAQGNITTFDAPGAGSIPGQMKGIKFQGTNAISINAGGVITGTYADANFVNHGYIRNTDGTFAEFDAPGAGGAGTFSTISGSINTFGGVAGAVQDANGVFHLFVRAPDGTISEFDAPGAGGAGVLDGTAGFGLNDSWVVTGLFADTNVVMHGFVFNFTPPSFGAANLSPISLTFAKQAIFTKSTVKKVTLTSVGTASLTSIIISITGANPGDFAQTNNCPPTLLIGKKCTISVSFAPTQAGTRTANLSVSDNAFNSPQIVPLTGTGVKQVAVSPASLTFPSQTVGTKSAPKTVTLTNNLPTTLTMNGITFTGANAGDFAETDNCDGSVPAKGKCTISVTFTPTATGARTATVNIADSANNSPQTLAVSGTGK